MTSRIAALRFDRRTFIAGSAAAGGLVLAGALPRHASAQSPLLKVGTRTLEVNGKPATVFSVLDAAGKPGFGAREGDRFSGTLLNATAEPLQMHWHGQTRAPAEQDRSRPGGGLLAAGQSDTHDFVLTPGTHWMHSHTLSEQQLLAAPMVTREKDAGDVQDVVIMLHDFAFRSPQEILHELGGSDVHGAHAEAAPTPGAAPPPPAPQPTAGMHHHGMPGMGGMGGGHMGRMGGHGHMAGMVHANDVRYDAFLANDRTLGDPQVVQVEKGGRVRLRIINGGTATAFFISTPGVASRCIAVDGSPCKPVSQASYPLAQGQRIDLAVDMPRAGGAFPVLAQVEAERFQTGIVLATAGATVAKLAGEAVKPQAMVGLAFDAALRAERPLSQRKPDRTFSAMLGEEPGYRWTINGRIHGEHVPFDVRRGERVELSFMNPTMMMHPMHLHGHHFQVVAIGGRRLAGPVRDTVVVPPHTHVTIAFDANLPGAWYLHCHHLYHMATGMMTEVRVA